MKAEDINVVERKDPRDPKKFSHIALNISGMETEVPIKFMRVSEIKELQKLLRKCFELGCASESDTFCRSGP